MYYLKLYKEIGDKDYFYQAQFLTDFYFMSASVGNLITDII